MEEKNIFYVNVSQMSSDDAEEYIAQLKNLLRNKSSAIIPTQEGETRVEVYTKNTKDEWVKQNPYIFKCLETARIYKLEIELELAKRRIVDLESHKWWQFWR